MRGWTEENIASLSLKKNNTEKNETQLGLDRGEGACIPSRESTCWQYNVGMFFV